MTDGQGLPSGANRVKFEKNIRSMPEAPQRKLIEESSG